MSNSAEQSNIISPKTKSESVWDVFGYLFYIGSIIFLIAAWGTLPDFGLFIILFMQFLERHP